MNLRYLLPLILCLTATTSYSQEGMKELTAQAQQQVSVKTYFVRLTPLRATFLRDMTEAEGKLMKEHFAYWSDQFAKGVLLFGGPVLDPESPFGVLVLKARTLEEAIAIAAADPSVKGGVNRIEVAEMQVAFFARRQ